MPEIDYVHGYSPREAERLHDQAASVQSLLHADLSYGPGRRVLEAGCGTGEQTLVLAANSPQAEIVAVDLSERSLAIARQRVAAAGYR
ncbi:MAG: class I SAM-dependent methyltransferase, partial [Candidatus Eremiobacteraeota bacterium]|nr:class I SAM-dependent methyltransferase [Candidatus Eremiobacteraeota bacterium]